MSSLEPKPAPSAAAAPPSWWRDGVLYQIYPRSFGDSNGDGIGDLRCVIAHLDHLEWLGIDGIWLNPTFPSRNEDWGYDVADYVGLHPDLGTLADLDELIAEAGARWRTITDGYEDRILVGESYVLDVDQLMGFYGEGEDQLHLAFNFLFVHADLDAAEMRAIVEDVEARLPELAWPVYTGSNHDAGRLATRWGGNDPRKARAALVLLLTLRGTPFLYYGDEIGLPEVEMDPRTALDPVARRTGDPEDNRDRCRTPMQWTSAPGAGFTRPEATPWLPFGDPAACNVEDQKADPGSTLHLVRDLIALRRAHPELHGGTYETLPAPDGAWAFKRGDRFAVALNLADGEAEVGGLGGRVAIGTDRARDGEAVDGTLRLGPWECAVVDAG